MTQMTYGTYTALAVTALQSMASSATVGWKGARVDNQTSVKAMDYEIVVSLTTANTAPANDKAVYVYISPGTTTDGGTTWLQADGGTTTLPTSGDASYTILSPATGPTNLTLLGVLSYGTQQQVMQGVFLLSSQFGYGSMPDGWIPIVVNFSGAALSTGCVVAYRAIT